MGTRLPSRLRDYAALLFAARLASQVLTDAPEIKNKVLNILMDAATPEMVWLWRLTLQEERIAQHVEDCYHCCLGLNPLDCRTASMLDSKLKVYRARLAEAERWNPKTAPKP